MKSSLATRKQANVYLGVGSNLGNRKANLLSAISLLSGISTVRKLSPIYQTSPVGFEKQPDFLNMACLVSISYEPEEFLKEIKAIEKKLGREKSFKNGPRLIDIDILFWGKEVIKTKNLQVPHPRAAEREFVLRPLSRIAPSLVHPLLRKSVSSLLASLEPQGIRYFSKAPLIQDIIESKQGRQKTLD